MLGSGLLEQLLGSIGALSAGLATAWMTYCGSRYVLSDLKTDYAKLRVAIKFLAGNSASASGGHSQ